MKYNIKFFNYQPKCKEIEFNAGRFSIDFPKFVKPLLVIFLLINYWYLNNLKIIMALLQLLIIESILS